MVEGRHTTPEERESEIKVLKEEYENLKSEGKVTFENLVNDMSTVLKKCYEKFDRDFIKVQNPPESKDPDSATQWEAEIAKLIDGSKDIAVKALVDKGIKWHNKSYQDIGKPDVSVSSDKVKEAVETAEREVYSIAKNHFRKRELPDFFGCDCSDEMKQSTKSYQDLYLRANGKARGIKDFEL